MLLPGRQDIYYMMTSEVLCLLMVTVTVTSQPLKVLQKSQDTNLNDLHILLDDTRLKFHQQAKVGGAWAAFEQAQNSLLPAIAMATELIRDGDLTTQEASDFMLNEFKHLFSHVMNDPRIFKWITGICTTGRLPLPDDADEKYPEILHRVSGSLWQFCAMLRHRGNIKDLMNMEMDL